MTNFDHRDTSAADIGTVAEWNAGRARKTDPDQWETEDGQILNDLEVSWNDAYLHPQVYTSDMYDAVIALDRVSADAAPFTITVEELLSLPDSSIEPEWRHRLAPFFEEDQ